MIGVDTHASRILSLDKNHFKDLKEFLSLPVCEGFNDKEGEGATIASEGTFIFTVESNEGQ